MTNIDDEDGKVGGWGPFDGWVPFDYADEVTPPPRPSPSDWIEMKDGRPFLAPIDDNDGGSTQDLTENPNVSFCVLTNFGSATLTIDDDGSWHTDRPMPHGAENVMLWADSDTSSPDMESLVESIFEMGDAEPGSYTVTFYTWSSGLPFVFHDGRFEAVHG